MKPDREIDLSVISKNGDVLKYSIGSCPHGVYWFDLKQMVQDVLSLDQTLEEAAEKYDKALDSMEKALSNLKPENKTRLYKIINLGCSLYREIFNFAGSVVLECYKKSVLCLEQHALHKEDSDKLVDMYMARYNQNLEHKKRVMNLLEKVPSPIKEDRFYFDKNFWRQMEKTKQAGPINKEKD